jgi:hypothetical protein
MKQTSVKPLPTIEYDEAGRHRIVVQGTKGEALKSDWAPVTEAVVLNGIYAGPTGGPFEHALFTIRAVEHQVLA